MAASLGASFAADYSKPDDGAYHDVHQVMLLRSRPDTVFMTTGVGLYRSSDGGEHWERLTGEEFRLAYPDHMMLSPDEKTLFMAGAKFHPGFWMDTHVADTMIGRSPRSRAQLGHRAEGLRRGVPRQYRGADHGVLARRLLSLFVGVHRGHRAYERGWR